LGFTGRADRDLRLRVTKKAHETNFHRSPQNLDYQGRAAILS
jgi:hypothetical protein